VAFDDDKDEYVEHGELKAICEFDVCLEPMLEGVRKADEMGVDGSKYGSLKRGLVGFVFSKRHCSFVDDDELVVAIELLQQSTLMLVTLELE
jgi:hypothetical protein